MELLDALMKAVEGKEICVRSSSGDAARTVIFVFTAEDDSAFLSEVEEDELVPLLERWCHDRRVNMGRVQ